MALLLSACGGESSNSDDKNELPSSGTIGGGGSAPVVKIPDQPQNDTATLKSFNQQNIFLSSQGAQSLVSLDLSNNQLLIALDTPNSLQLLDVTDLSQPSLIINDGFATSTEAATGDYEEEEEAIVRAFDDDDDHGSLMLFPNTLLQASFDKANPLNIWAVVPYRAPNQIETDLGIGYGSQYGVYTGASSLLSATGENSDSFIRATTKDADGNILANTGYIKKILQSENGRQIGWQVYENTTTGLMEHSFVELNSQAQVSAQSSGLTWKNGDELQHWAIDKDGETLAIITKDLSSSYNLHLLDIKVLANASMRNSILMPLSSVASSAEVVSDVTFFDSSKAIAIAMANRVDIFDVTSSTLTKRNSLSYVDSVSAIESHPKRGFLAVMHGDDIELLAAEKPEEQVSTLQLSQTYQYMDMEEDSLVVFSATHYQLLSY